MAILAMAPTQSLSQERLCTLTAPNCPIAVDIPTDHGIQDVCGDGIVGIDLPNATYPKKFDLRFLQYGTCLIAGQECWPIRPPYESVCKPGAYGTCFDTPEFGSSFGPVPESYPDSYLTGAEPSNPPWKLIRDFSSTLGDWNFVGYSETPKTYTVDYGPRFKQGLFEIQRIQATTRYKWDGGSNEWDYWDRRKIFYTVKCDNGITYQDDFEWEQYSHDCYAGINNTCSKPTNTWDEISLTEWNPDARTVKGIKLPEGPIVHSWRSRTVGTPRYLGGPNKLAVPIVMIAGIGEDYNVWGVEPAGTKGSPEWLLGLVKDYQSGSLPDVITKAYSLEKGTNINTNGIYFVNIDPNLDINTVHQDKAIQTKMMDIVLAHVGSYGSVPPSFQMDIVCHSTGCLALREAIERAKTEPPVYGLFHPLNHIRKIVTVNAPHTGTGLGKSTSDQSGFLEYGGLPELIGQIETPNDQQLVQIKIELDYSAFLFDSYAASFEDWNSVDNSLKNLGNLIGGFFGVLFGHVADIGSEIAEMFGYDGWDSFHVTVKGGLFGPHQTIVAGFPGKMQNDLVYLRDVLAKSRNDAVNLHTTWFTAERLRQGYPQRADGSYIELVPFYSHDTRKTLASMLDGVVGKSFDNLCVGIADPMCLDVQKIANQEAKVRLRGVLERNVGGSQGLEDLNVTFSPWFKDLLNKLNQGWLKESDLLVEKSSQIWDLAEGKLDEYGAPIEELKPARTYKIHYSDYPEGHPKRPVLHTPFRKLPVPEAQQIPTSLAFADNGSTLMGLDLFCGLDAACNQLTGVGRVPIYLGPAVLATKNLPPSMQGQPLTPMQVLEQMVELKDDYEVMPIIDGANTGIEVRDANGVVKARVVRTENGGTEIWIDNQPQIYVPVFDNKVQTTTVLKRRGNQLSATISTQHGQQKEMSLGTVQGSINTISVFTTDLSAAPARLLGVAQPAQVQNTLPVYGSVKVLGQERGQSEANQSRPWLAVTNLGATASQSMSLTYYFTADPTRTPVVELDYPRDIAVTTQHLGGDLWSFTLPVPVIESIASWPKDGALQFRLHYADWTPWVTQDDWSVGAFIGSEMERVVLRDAQGRLVWGEAPALQDYLPIPMEQSEPMALQLSFMDGGAGEANMIRPRMELRNMDSRALDAGYTIGFAFKTQGSALPVLEGWWDPNFEGELERNGEWIIATFQAKHRLHSAQTIRLGEWGVHMANYARLDKSQLGSITFVLDPQNNLVFGAMPSASIPNAQTDSVLVQAAFYDGSPWEQNQIRPRVDLQHLAGMPLEVGSRVVLHLPGDFGSTLPQLTAWYAPDWTGSLNVDEQGLVLQWTSKSRLFAGQTTTIQDWGIHYSSWIPLDKSGLGLARLEVFDHLGNKVYP